TYQHHRSTTNGFNPTGSTAVAGATSAAYTHTGLTNGTAYYFKRVVSDSSTSAISNQVTATPSAAGGDPPITGTTDNFNDGTIAATWYSVEPATGTIVETG